MTTRLPLSTDAAFTPWYLLARTALWYPGNIPNDSCRGLGKWWSIAKVTLATLILLRMAMRLVRLSLFVLSVAFMVNTIAPSRGAETFFEETLLNSVQSPNLDGEEFFRLANGEGIQRISSSSHFDRRYVRTVVGAFNKLDFVYEVTFTIAVDEIVFIGIGQGEPDAGFNEPARSLNFRIHSPGLVNGKVEILGVIIGNLTSSGPHRIRITKLGDSMIYAVDSDFEDQFQADMSYTVSNLRAVALFLRDQDSHLFFGNSEVTTTYRDLVIAPNPNVTRFRRDDANGDGRQPVSAAWQSQLFLAQRC